MNQAGAPSNDRRLLVVDDDRLVLAVVGKGLTRAGYRVTTAESEEDAQAWLAGGERPHLAILDVSMPGPGGLHLARRLHELDHVPFIMFSAYSEPETVQRATAYGALGYVVKPQDVAQLIPAIEAALGRANELQELRETRQQLQKALDSERNISVATGIIMMEYRLKRTEAFVLLRDTARKQRRKLAEVADDIVAARETLNFDGGRVDLPAKNADPN